MKVDPIGPRHYQPLITAEKWVTAIYWLCIVLSFAAVLIDRARLPAIADAVAIAFPIAVIAHFALGQMIRLHWQPRAEDKRRQDFLSSAFGVNLTTERSSGYYNNSETEPLRRIGAQTLENSLFSMRVVSAMATFERWKIALYALLWVGAVFYRPTELEVIVVAAQAVFSEQILSRFLRIEWLRMKCERTFDDLYKLLEARVELEKFKPWAIDCFTAFETAKSVAAIQLSQRVFTGLNETVTREWDEIRKKLGL